jgi:hypothetical protein
MTVKLALALAYSIALLVSVPGIGMGFYKESAWVFGGTFFVILSIIGIFMWALP